MFFHLARLYIKAQVYCVVTSFLSYCIVSMLCKNMEESVHMIYGEIAEKLISIHFQFSFEESTLGI